MRSDPATYLHLLLLRRLSPWLAVLLVWTMLASSGLLRVSWIWWFGFVYLSLHLVSVLADHVKVALRVRRYLLENAKGSGAL